MKSDRIIPASGVLAAALAVALTAGCAATPFDYREVSDAPDGPGMFSGSNGKLTLFSSKTAAAREAAQPGEFAERRTFEEFRRHKSAGEKSPEYREFQEWREWQEYRAWKERKR